MVRSKRRQSLFAQSLFVRPRLLTGIIVGVLVGIVLSNMSPLPIASRLLISWDIGAAIYLSLTALMMYRSDENELRCRAEAQDDGALIILGFTVLGVLASLGAIFAELVAAKSASGKIDISPVILAALTVVVSWFCMQTIFAVHYAHEYYQSRAAGSDGGLEFPADFHKPDYWDFVYFSFVIGTAAATADINITSGMIRRIVTLHCILVFFFNTSILALAINVGASLV